MILINQISRLKQAEKLDDLGLRLPTIWGYNLIPSDDFGIPPVSEGEIIFRPGMPNEFCLPAYSCAELEFLEIYIRGLSTYPISIEILNNNDQNYYTLRCGCEEYDLGNFQYGAHWRSEAIITLLENEIIKPEQLTLDDKCSIYEEYNFSEGTLKALQSL